MSQDTTYIVAVEDLFRVEAASQEEAEQKLINGISDGSFEIYDAMVVDVEE